MLAPPDDSIQLEQYPRRSLNDYCRSLGVLADIERALDALRALAIKTPGLSKYSSLLSHRSNEEILRMPLKQVCGLVEDLLEILSGGSIESSDAIQRKITRVRITFLQFFRRALRLEAGPEGVSVLESFPRLPIDRDMTVALRLAHIDESGESCAWPTLPYDSQRTIPGSVASLLENNMPTKSTARRRARYESELFRRYAEDLPLEEGRSLRNILTQLEGKRSDLVKRFLELSVACVSPYEASPGERLKNIQNGKNREFFFDWFFHNFRNIRGMSTQVEYPIENVFQLIEFIRGTLESLGGMQEPYARRILEKITCFTESPAYENLEKIRQKETIHIPLPTLTGRELEIRGISGVQIERLTPDYLVELRSKLGTDESYSEGFMQRFLDLPGPRDVSTAHLDPEKLRSYLYGRQSDALQIIDQMVTGVDPQAVETFYSALRDFEYVLTWLGFYESLSEPVCIPQILEESHGPLEIRAGRSISLLVAKPGEEIVPQSISFGPDCSAIGLLGANGAGKTHTLETVVTTAHFSHKGQFPLADAVTTSPIGHIEHRVNTTIHTTTSSSFENWVKDLLAIIQRIERGELKHLRGIVNLDEPGRGTDAIDAIPIIFGLMHYFKSKGIYFGFSSHLNDRLLSYADFLEELGVKAQFFTMNRETHTLHPLTDEQGVSCTGREVAEAQGWEREILEIADAISDQMHSGDSELKLPVCLRTSSEVVKTPAPGFRLLRGNKDLVEMGTFLEASDYRIGAYLRPGEFTYDFSGGFSPLSEDFLTRDPHPVYGTCQPGLRPDAAVVFHSLYTQAMTPTERADRVASFKILLETEVRPEADEEKDEEEYFLHEKMWYLVQDLKQFRRMFSLNIDRLPSESPFAVLALAMFGGQKSEIEDKYLDFIYNSREASLPTLLNYLRVIADTLQDAQMPALREQCEIINAFLQSDAYRDIAAFWEAHPDTPISFQDWKQWVTLCHNNRSVLEALEQMILELNFYVTVASSIDHHRYVLAEDSPSGDVRIKNMKNVALVNQSQHLKGDERFEVVPTDVFLSSSRPVVIVSGTNGGGKTQGINALADLIYRKQQLGYVSAETASIPDYAFMSFSRGSSEHTGEASSWENECRGFKEILDEYKAAGEPSNGIVFLDEPGRGTSEEEAIPLLIGIMKYFERRGVKVVLTTHFSSIYSYLERIEVDEKIDYQAVHVDLFSDDPLEKFKFLEGVGKSHGLRRAKQLGLPSEIISIAERVQERMLAA